MSTVSVPPPAERKPEVREHDATALISRGMRARPLFDPEILRRATKESFVKLNPRLVAKNPVMFVVEVGAALTTVFVIKDALSHASGVFFGTQIALWLWFTVLFANFASHGRGARKSASRCVAQDED
jgi:K+-transporting ATPase ATPase B chain